MRVFTGVFTILLNTICVIAQTSPAKAPETSPISGKKAPASSAPAPIEKTSPIRVPRFDNPPIIDGNLNDEAWSKAAVLKDFYQIYPGNNLPASKPTEVLLGYDSKFLYIGFRAYDEPDKVRANVAKRDDIFNDDYVGVFLDTFNDQLRAYEIFVNPFGIQQDGIMTEGVGEDFSVDIVFDSKGMVAKDGYTVEIAIPFKSLRYHAGKDKLWGVHFFRRIKRFNNELSSWMPISQDRAGRLEISGHVTAEKSGLLNQAGHITNLENLWDGLTLELIPTMTVSEIGNRVRTLPSGVPLSDPTIQDPGRFINRPSTFDPGLTAKFGITPNVTLSLTINPDFAQVESDLPVIIANQRFPIFFDEKRPFFLEGIDIFQTPLTPVHTRTIIDPDYAAKLTGKIGANTFGLLLASDNAPGNFSREERTDPTLFPSIERFIDKKAYIGILRLKRDIGEDSNIGLLATTYNFIEKHNNVAGVDGRLRIDPQTVLSFQVLGTTSRRFFFDSDLGETLYRTGNGFGYYYNYSKAGSGLTYRLTGEGRTQNYRADVGFTQRTDNNRERFLLRYNSESNSNAKIISWIAQKQTTVYFDWQGRMQRWDTYPSITFNFKRQSFFTLYYLIGYERLFEEEFGQKRTATRPGAFFGPDPERRVYYKAVEIECGSQLTKKYFFHFDAYYKLHTFDFDFGEGPRFPRVSPAALIDPNAPLDPQPGNQLFATLSFSYQPFTSLHASLDYTKSKLVRNDTRLTAFDENIFSLRATYQFTRFTFARARIDYDTLLANARGQFLVGWTPNPSTSFYVGYNDDLNYNGFNPFTQQFEPGYRRNSRMFFIKLSYLLRYTL